MTLDPETFDYLKPSEEQMLIMQRLRGAASAYAAAVEAELSDGPDKTYLLRKFREVAMWVNIAITRRSDGSVR
jgi:hypothetical protein